MINFFQYSCSELLVKLPEEVISAKTAMCRSRGGGGGGGGGDRGPGPPLENLKFYGFLYKPPHPGKCWTPSETLENSNFL